MNNINLYDDFGNRNDRAVWYSTPSHGYLKVLLSGVILSGFKPSTYSYQDNNHYYLEEDCDAVGYLKSLHNDDWINHAKNIPESYTDKFIDQIIGDDYANNYKWI